MSIIYYIFEIVFEKRAIIDDKVRLVYFIV